MNAPLPPPPAEPSAFSLVQLKALCSRCPEHLLEPWIRWLERDPRKGSRALVAQLVRRQRRARAFMERWHARFREERRYWQRGLTWVAGIDEAGRGPVAGPVVAAAVILDPERPLLGLDDSKRLTPAQREALAQQIREQAIAVAVGEAAVEEIDRFNILRATLLAMRRAVEALTPQPQVVLIDGVHALVGYDRLQRCFKAGELVSNSIAAASVLAKVHRDRLMDAYDRRYPGYGFAEHKGYLTERHRAALARLGPSPIHRRSFTY